MFEPEPQYGLYLLKVRAVEELADPLRAPERSVSWQSARIAYARPVSALPASKLPKES